MSRSKTNKDRKEKLNKYKQKHKKKKMSNEQPKLPEIQQYPVWDSNELLEIYGAEWQEIFNFINGVQSAYMATSSVMNRNVLSGKIRMRFEKLVDGQYVPMTKEEEAPHQKQFQDTIQQAKDIAAKAVKESQATPDSIEYPSQEGLPVLDAIVNENGVPYSEGQETDKPNSLKIVRDEN